MSRSEDGRRHSQNLTGATVIVSVVVTATEDVLRLVSVSGPGGVFVVFLSGTKTTEVGVVTVVGVVILVVGVVPVVVVGVTLKQASLD